MWSQVGYLVESPTAYPELTVRENLEVARRLRKLPDAAGVERAIDLLGLRPYADRQARKLSLGNAQRLGLAKALLHSPSLLVLDEPVNGLDPAGVAEVRELLVELAREQGVTVLLSSHLLGEVARTASRIGVLHEGRLRRRVRHRSTRGPGAPPPGGRGARTGSCGAGPPGGRVRRGRSAWRPGPGR